MEEITVTAESVLKVEVKQEISEEYTAKRENLEREEALTVKREVKTEDDEEEELEPPAAVFVVPIKVEKEEMAEEDEISQKFYRNFNFPSVYGAIDCTLIKILNPGGFRAETFRCRKGFFALNVQTLSDPDLYIRNLVVRWPGSAHDSTVFDHSYLRAHLKTEVPSRYHVLGDSGYPLRSYLMTPILNPANGYQMRYNAAHIVARNAVERQYGVWKRRFACISSPLRCRLKNAQTIIVATAVLHNLAISLGDVFEEVEIQRDADNYINNEYQIAGIAKRNAIVANFFTN